MSDSHHTVLLVDDHPVFRNGLRSCLEDEEDIRVIGEAGDGTSALRLIRDLSPDIVVMDITMPDLNGIEATKLVVSEFPDTRVVALSIHAEQQFVQDMLQAGAAGYMLKDSGAEELIKGMRAVIAGKGYLSPAITGLVVSQFRKASMQEQTYQEKTFEILETKFHVPQLPADHVPRSRLVDRLETDRQLAVQCIVAPAGYGKSTLVSDWLSRHQRPYAWISLEEGENDLRKFITCVVHAVHTIFPNGLPKTEALMKVGSLPPIQTLASIMVNELNRIQEDFTLVFDDLHVIREKSVHDLFTEMFRYPIAAIHIVLISRTDPMLPLSRLRAQNSLSEIRLTELKFNQIETELFLNKIFGDDINQSVSCSWYEKTEGWVTGLRLATLSVSHQNGLDTLLQEIHGSGHYAMEYLFNEVWEKQPDIIRRQMTAVSILERFNAKLLEDLSTCINNDEGDIDGWDILKLIKKNNLFLIPLDNEGIWFRFHHLFQDLLQGQLKRTCSSEEISDLHLRAGTWFSENGLLEEAVNHMLSAGRPDSAGELVANLGHALIDKERVMDLEKFLRKLPQDVIDDNPLLLIFEAWLARINRLIPKITENLNRVEEILKREPPPEPISDIVWVYLYSIRAYEHYCMLDHTKAIICAKRALETVPPEYAYMRAFASIVHAAALQMSGRYQEALSIMKSAQSDPGLQRKHTQAILLGGLSPICMMEADHFMLQKTAARLLQLGNETGLPVLRSWGRRHLAVSHYMRNDLEEAKRILAFHLEDRYLMYPDTVVDGAVILSLCLQLLGRPEEARQVSDLLYQHALETDHPGVLLAAQAFHAELALRQGRRDEAIAWTRVFEPRDLHAHHFFFLPELTLAKVLISEDTVNSIQSAQRLLLDIENFSRSTCNRSVLIPTLLLQAMVLYSQDRAACLEKAAEAVALAETGGGLRCFLEYDEPMKDILRELKENNVGKEFIEQLLTEVTDHEQEISKPLSSSDTLNFSSPVYPGIDCLSDPLTDREQEILKQLVKGYSNKEIGENLFISIDTVKSHLKRMYQKLDVKSRLQAVAKAAELGVRDSK